MTYISSTPFLDTAFDLTTTSFITVLLVLCLLSLCSIFYLRFKSRSLLHLQSFNSLWTVRFLLVLSTTLWSLNELLRLPTFLPRRPETFCKASVVASLGLLQPAFLVTLLFLVDVSVKKRTPTSLWALCYILTMCLPILCLQSLLVFSEHDLGEFWPPYFRRSYAVVSPGLGSQEEEDKKTVLCTYPLLTTVVFGAFGIGYSFWFTLSCWKVVSMVINKNLRIRIYALAAAVMASVPVQVGFLGLSVVWDPGQPVHGVVTLLVFLSAFVRAVVGQGVLVIGPIADSLAVGAEFCSRSSSGAGDRRRMRVVDA